MKELVKILIFIAIIAFVFMFLGSSLEIKIFDVLFKIAVVIDAFVLIGIVYKKFFT